MRTRAVNEMTLSELLAARSEAEFQRDVLKTAKSRRWDFAYHTKISIGSSEGFPDLVFVRKRDRRVVWMELKGPKTTVSAAQLAWNEALVACGHEAYIFRPCDEERVREVLE